MGGRNAFIAATRFPYRLRAPGRHRYGRPGEPAPLCGDGAGAQYFGIANDDVFFTKEQAETLEQTITALGKRYQIEHCEARRGWAVIDTPVYDAAEAERHWKAILALFGEELSA